MVIALESRINVSPSAADVRLGNQVQCSNDREEQQGPCNGT